MAEVLAQGVKLAMAHMTRTFLRRTPGRFRSARGATLIEAAIALPMMLLITFGIVDFGYLFYVYLALETGVSQATRFGVTGNLQPGMNRVESMRDAFRRATPTLTVPDAAFEFSHMSVGGSSWISGTGGPGEVEKLTVNYTHNVLILRPFFTNGQMQMRVESAMKNENRFQ
jgi:hypothetical protein